MKHVAIMKDKFFDMILSGEKTIESRWSMNKVAPYGKIQRGDEIWFKKTGKDVTMSARALDVKFFELTPEIVEKIRIKFGKQIGTDHFSDWQETLQKRFCTLIWLGQVKQISPIEVPKSCGAGWLILKD